MSKTLEVKINNFSGGISDDPRKSSSSEFIVTKHFDIFSQPQKLIPYRSLKADTNDGSTSTGMKQFFIRDFLYASSSAKMYGLGQTAAGLAKIVYKADATSGNWTLPASSEGNGAVKNGCFFEYKDYLWGFQGTNQLFKYGTLSGTPSITNTAKTVGATITSVANGIIQPSTGFAYVAYNNVLVRIESDTTTITDNAKTVPTNLKIVSLANFGNNIAIGCAPVNSYNGASKVFLWNGSSDLFTETLDFGEGDLRIIETIEGMIVGVTDRYLNNSIGAGKGSMIIQAYSGGSPQVVKEIFTEKLTGITMPNYKAVKNNRLFFAAKIMTNAAGTEYNEGIWSFGRKNVNYPYTLTIDIIDENVNTSGIQSFATAGNYFFISHSGDGSIDKTDETATYSFTSIYESLIYDFGDVDSTKRLETFKVSFKRLTAGQSITAKIKWDDETSWTTLGSFNTVGEISKTFNMIESTGNNFPSGKELKVRLESTGGLEPTSYAMRATVLNTI
jgi:hypothetical protein